MTRRLKLGFNARIAFPTGHAAEALREGIELFRVAEQLGYDTGWVYQRHFDNYLAAPLVFHAAVAQHTERIGLGTAIIGVRYEDPVLLAEAAGTADLLSGGRLQLGLGTGQGGYDGVFGQEPNDGREQSLNRLAGFLRGIRGERLGVVTDPAGLVAAGTELVVRPTSPTLPGRIWYGASSVASAERVGRRGLRLLLSTILSGQVDDYGAELARAIEAYHAAYATQAATHGATEQAAEQAAHHQTAPAPAAAATASGGTAPRAAGRTAVARSVLPATSPELARVYAAYDEERRTQGPAASRPRGALTPAAAPPARFTMSPVQHGDPAAVVDQLLADPSVPLADELIAFLPPAFGLRQNLRLLEDIAATVAPRLGWTPAPTAGEPAAPPRP
ncbi:flavin-dependent oxidoreductase, F420-dependent methylene-tetrahydromethanopterin reductase [Frankia sp. EI5c]|uniref:LLM class flavin-dependent oxidoreductase n=1 Tax=Frankia sp. EI5c TaxID=683316 RepID=UPI0007C2C248|nr:LLM class flavin-dependent oxidoreductase [Frankia sp. EI5c]OAA21844.1 flavin-dependent oxidoreductase, F420-dependent methylene-tetrahydromethanopterin reductase [Frankia sp. EI5c]